MSFQNLDVEIDFVGIIDMLPQTERDALNISSDLSKFLASLGVEQKVGYCGKNDHVWNYLQQFICLSKTKNLILHFVSHGNENGLGIKGSGEPLITWADFKGKLTQINTAMGGNLIINLTSCFGFHGTKMVGSDDKDFPFYGIIGCEQKILPTEAKQVNELFYKGMSDGKEIPAVVIEIIKSFGYRVIYGRTAQTQKKMLDPGNSLSL